MNFHIITLFPDLVRSYLSESILARAVKNKKIKVDFYNPREYVKATGAQKKNIKPYLRVDDKPYGGGAGMVLQAEPVLKAVDDALRKIEKKTLQLHLGRKLKIETKKTRSKIIIFSAKGKPFNQKIAYEWVKKYSDIVFITGRYEGIDERVKVALKAEEVSIGPYVLTDGDVAAMVLTSAVGRLVPGVIRLESLAEESHFNLLLKREIDGKVGTNGLEYAHYTRPEVLKYKGKNYKVPKVLLSGDHKKIEEFRSKN